MTCYNDSIENYGLGVLAWYGEFNDTLMIHGLCKQGLLPCKRYAAGTSCTVYESHDINKHVKPSQFSEMLTEPAASVVSSSRPAHHVPNCAQYRRLVLFGILSSCSGLLNWKGKPLSQVISFTGLHAIAI